MALNLFPRLTTIRPTVDMVMRLGDALGFVARIEIGTTNLTPILIVLTRPCKFESIRQNEER